DGRCSSDQLSMISCSSDVGRRVETEPSRPLRIVKDSRPPDPLELSPFHHVTFSPCHLFTIVTFSPFSMPLIRPAGILQVMDHAPFVQPIGIVGQCLSDSSADCEQSPAIASLEADRVTAQQMSPRNEL